MPSCVKLPSIAGTLPFPFTAPTLPTVAIKIGTPGTTCCAYTIPGFSFNVQIPVPGLATALLLFMPAINAIMEPAYAALDSFQIPICNL